MGESSSGISEMLLELCVTELEDVASNTDASRYLFSISRYLNIYLFEMLLELCVTELEDVASNTDAIIYMYKKNGV